MSDDPTVPPLTHDTNEFDDHATDCPRCVAIDGVRKRFPVGHGVEAKLIERIVDLEHELATLKKYENATMILNGESHKVSRALYLGAGIVAVYMDDG